MPGKAKRKQVRNKKALLEYVEVNPNLSDAAFHIGVHPTAVYKWKREDPQFVQDLEDALEIGYNRAGDALMSRAVEKTAEDKLKVKDSADLKWMISRRLPKVYGNSIKHEGSIEGLSLIHI